MKKAHGFTLIELLLAMFILAILASIITVGLQQLLSSRRVIIENQQKANEVQLAIAIIERDLLQVINRPVVDSNNKERPAFMENNRNREGAIEFTRMGYFNPNNLLPRSELQRVVILRQKGHLIRQHWPNLDRTREMDVRSRILLRDITRLSWRFMDKDKKFYDIWPPTARQTNTVPAAVEISLAGTFGNYTRLFILPGQAYVLAR